jgi:acyl-CoA reductase-like NAD-dependent aldehyde dehydrogenase
MAVTYTRTPKQGVVDIIAPWNYPLFTALNSCIPALLAGNAVSLKHESCPLVGFHFHAAFHRKCLWLLYALRTLSLPPSLSVDATGGALSHLLINRNTSDSLFVDCDHLRHRVFTGSVRAGREMAALLACRAQVSLPPQCRGSTLHSLKPV